MIVNGGVVQEAEYPHPIERVWRALVNPEELGAWLMPTDFAPEVGRRFTLHDHPPIGLINGEVLAVEPPRLLRCRWSAGFGDTVVEFRLTPTDSGTHLRITHEGWDPQQAPARGQFDEGWVAKLAKDLPALLNDQSA